MAHKIKKDYIKALTEVKILVPPRVIKETLSRMGIGNKTERTLSQICHLIHYNKRFYLIHYKDVFALQGNDVFWRDEDFDRKRAVAILLHDWGLIELEEDFCRDIENPLEHIYTIRNSERQQYDLKTKVNILSFVDALRDLELDEELFGGGE